MTRTNLFTTLAILILISCNPKDKEIPAVNLSADYAQFIKSHTTGPVSKADDIYIQFAEQANLKSSLDEHILIKPTITGTWTSKENGLVQFSPEKHLENGQNYQVTIDMDAFYSEIPEELRKAQFSFNVLPMDFQIDPGTLGFDSEKPDQLTTQISLRSSDIIEDAQVEKMFTIDGASPGLDISWQHIHGQLHTVMIRAIPRKENAYVIPYHFDGAALNIDQNLKGQIEVPAKGEFRILSVKADPNGANFLEVVFSEPLDPKQNMDGLINIEGVDQYTYQILSNRLQIYFGNQLEGDKQFTVYPGIRNTQDGKLTALFEKTVSFALMKPEIKIASSGTILPSSNAGTIPFETINLKAVNVSIHKIYNNNIPQFFQDNTLSRSDNIYRVGDEILHKTIPLNLNGEEDLNEWKQNHLDLQALFDLEPGIIYQLEIGMHPSFSLWPCNTSDSLVSVATTKKDWLSDPYPSYDYWTDFYPEGYSWREEGNPCHISYYNGNRTVKRNILTSDLGLIAKVSNDESVHIVTTNLITGSAEPNTELILLDYQMQVIVETQSDASGQARIAPEERPYLLIAQKGQQKSYLRMDDGQALSVSQFNVSGAEVKEGIKVFMYGERGVWRPGDPIHLSCIIDDTQNPLPEDYPITYQLKNTTGAIMDQQIVSRTDQPILSFESQTQPQAETGNWSAEILIGSQSFQKNLKIETIKPNRLKVNLEIPDQLTTAQPQMNVPIQVQWLTGIPGKNLNYEYSMVLWDREIPFTGYEQFQFRDPSRSFSFAETDAFKGVTDEQGNSTANLQVPQVNEAPGKMKLILKGKVFEPGGNFSIDNQVLDFSPYSHYVGINIPEKQDGSFLNSNTDINIQTISLTQEGNRASSRSLSYTLSKMRWRWWWDQSGNRANYVRSDIYEEVASGKVSATDGITSFSINQENGGRYYLQVCDDESGHCTGQDLYISWRDGEDQEMGANILTLSSKKESYNIGEDIVLSIPGYDQAKALVSIENGSSVLHQEWIKLQEGSNDYRIQASREMAPNVYLHVALIQPHNQTINDLPIRLYGIAPVTVQDPGSQLKPTISLPDQVEPEKPFTLQVAEADDRPMQYTIAIVDEGLLNITNYATPDPWDFFNAKEALGVKTWDLYDQVIGAYGTRIERSLSVGGDGSVSLEGERQPNRFEPVVQFMGPFTLEAKEKKQHEITLPNYIGSVKTMVIAANPSGEYGHTEKQTRVTKPLMVQSTLPRVISPNEQSIVPVSVFALEEGLGQVEVSIETEGSIELIGSARQTVNFDETGDQIIQFTVAGSESLGSGTIRINANSNRHSATEIVNLLNRAPNPVITKSMAQVLDIQESANLPVERIGIPETQENLLELSVIPPLNLEKRLNYLIRYPHGCIEQTISRAFPQIYLPNLLELSVQQKDEINRHIDVAIKKLSSFQSTEGGFSYWPGRYVDYWSTSYVGNFLLEARDMGFQVPQTLLDPFLAFQRRTAKSWRRNGDYNDDIQQTYRLYTLALAGKPELGLMNRLLEDPQLSSLAQYQLASTFAMAGFDETAKAILDKVSTTYQPVTYRNTFGSATRNKAIMLEAYQYTGLETQAYELMRELAEELSSNRWLSTHTLAYTLKSVGKLVGNQSPESGIQATITLPDGQSIDIQSDKTIHQTSIPVSATEGSITVQNKLDQKLFASIITEGVPLTGQEVAGNNGLSLSVQYLNAAGETIRDITTLKQGTDIQVITTVQNISPNTIQHLALSHLVPPGWEIANDRLIDGFRQESAFNYQDIRDDRVLTYFDLSPGKSIAVKVDFTNTYAGMFYLPAIAVEAMYDHNLFARTTGQWIEITP